MPRLFTVRFLSQILAFALILLDVAVVAVPAIAQKPDPKQPEAPATRENGTANENSTDPAKPQHEPIRLPGIQPGGKVLLPTGWSLQPAGKQLKLGDFPVNIALHPTEPFAAVLHSGWGDHEIVVVDLKSFEIISRVTLPQSFCGLCFSPDGKQIFASGAESGTVHQFQFAKGYLADHREIKLGETADKLVPAGLTTTADGKTLIACLAWGDVVKLVSLDDPTKQESLALNKDDYPYTPLVTKDGKRLYVSLWGRAGVAVFNLEAKRLEALWATSSHPTEMVLSPAEDVLYVACANSNHVAVIETKSGKPLETISSALYPQAPSGSTPNSLCLSPDGKMLFIANADNNNLAVLDVSEKRKSKSLGFIPVGWYPTSVRYSAQDSRIYVANGKGLISKANPNGPNPLHEPPKTIREFIGGLFLGSLGAIDPPTPAQMARYTKQAFECSPLREDRGPVAAPREADNPIPAQVGDPSPIKHCLYIIKENRTYDQVFGDIKEGNGDPNLCLFPAKITPNHHALVREYVLLDNFYVEAEVSADGHEWSMAAYATDFVEKTWPLVYRKGGHGIFRYPAEGSLPIAAPASGYIWDRAKEANVTYRSYGEFIANGKTANDPSHARLPSLEGHFDPKFRGFDLDFSDQKRVDQFLAELKAYEEKGDWPQLVILRLPNDHTAGAAPGKTTPTAMVADNDLALGRVVEGVSHSKFWKETAIFVVEDDAQNGSDHVDAHRTVALVISPYTKRHYVDSSMYSTSGMLRTMELILGLKPMTQFDAAALPMFASFQGKPDAAAFAHGPANVDLAEKNKASMFGAAESAKMDLSKEDAVDDILLNEIIWRSVKGVNSPMPAPVRASFVFQPPKPKAADKDDDDDDD